MAQQKVPKIKVQYISGKIPRQDPLVLNNEGQECETGYAVRRVLVGVRERNK
jgi:hypothetical protein